MTITRSFEVLNQTPYNLKVTPQEETVQKVIHDDGSVTYHTTRIVFVISEEKEND